MKLKSQEVRIATLGKVKESPRKSWLAAGLREVLALGWWWMVTGACRVV